MIHLRLTWQACDCASCSSLSGPRCRSFGFHVSAWWIPSAENHFFGSQSFHGPRRLLHAACSGAWTLFPFLTACVAHVQAYAWISQDVLGLAPYSRCCRSRIPLCRHQSLSFCHRLVLGSAQIPRSARQSIFR